jgi:hypothetical protein
MADEPAPYPPAPKGTKYRQLPFPVESPDRAPKPMTATRTDGKVVDLLATIGERPRAAQPRSPDELVGDWRPVE